MGVSCAKEAHPSSPRYSFLGDVAHEGKDTIVLVAGARVVQLYGQLNVRKFNPMFGQG